MRTLKLSLLAGLMAVGLVGCGLMYGDPEIVVHSPNEGQVFQIGQPVLISWECENCEFFVDRSLRISLSPADGGGIPFSYDIGRDFLSGTKSWSAGTVEGGTVQPGLYWIHFGAECESHGERGYCAVRSGTFRLVH